MQFNATVRALLEKNEHAPLVAYEAMGDAARMSMPTPEHYLPLLYIAGARREGDATTILTDGIELASVSMLSVAYGQER